MSDIVVAIAIIGLTITNVVQSYYNFKLKILDKSKDVQEFKSVTEKPREIEDTGPVEVEIPLY